jgi:hypothetical protein
MSNKLALCALLLVAFVFSASLSVDAQKRKVNGAATLIEPVGTLLPEANEAADIDQCHNGGVNAPVQPCVDGQWVNGNANGNQAHYAEGDYIHYRIKFTNLITTGRSYTILLGYDFLKNGKHAIDYLGTYNKDSRFDPVSPGLADYPVEPCLTGAPCTGSVTSTWPIPKDNDEVTPFIMQEDGVFTMWGGNITGVSAYGYDGAETRTIAVTFIPTVSNPVLAWGGHISNVIDWGGNNTATAGDINGSPYHMRIQKNVDFTGQQDRQLSVSAIITTGPSAAPATITGRVTDRYGRGIYGARVQLFDASTGAATVAVTNTFGYYRFSDVAVGDAYVMSVYHSRYLFVNGSTSFSLEADLAGVNFVAN